MKKTKKAKRSSGRPATPVPPAASREPAQLATSTAAETDAPVTSDPRFKAGKDL